MKNQTFVARTFVLILGLLLIAVNVSGQPKTQKAATQEVLLAKANKLFDEAHSLGTMTDAKSGAKSKKLFREASVLYLHLAQKGNVEAQYEAGIAYARGYTGLPLDLDKAHFWVSLAAAQGHKFAIERLEIGFELMD